MIEAFNENSEEISAPSTAPRIVVCCDGSWCGDGTDTTSNVEIFAAAFAGADPKKGIRSMRSTKNRPYYNTRNDSAVAYFDGVGTNGSIVDYLLNGALALDIKELCVEAYLFIVKQYDSSAWEDLGSQIYFIGLSRGAYTVRMVASMINNFGILRRDMYHTKQDLEDACEEVYEMHANDDPKYNPNSDLCKKFRLAKSHATKRPPIKFMGLFDTVGALGVPFVNAGDRLRYGRAKQFSDQNVSWEVECVYQALALTDRMSLFTPCYVDRSHKPIDLKRKYKDVQYMTEQRWFPGSHYDIGRQRFVLLRSNDSMAETLARWGIQMFNLLKLNITYTKELADPPFEYLVDALRVVDRGALTDEGAGYIERYSKDDLPPTWRVLWFKPLTIDAYDGIATAEGSQGPIARLVRWSLKTTVKHLVPGVSLTIWAIKGAVDLIVKQQVLVDRHVPLWFSSKDFGNKPYLEDFNGNPYHSHALQKYRLMRLQEEAVVAAEGGAAPPPQPALTEPTIIYADDEVSAFHPPVAPSTQLITPPSAQSNAAAAHTSPSAAGASAHAVGAPATSKVSDGVAESMGELSE